MEHQGLVIKIMEKGLGAIQFSKSNSIVLWSKSKEMSYRLH